MRARIAGNPVAAMKRPDDGLPEDIREHMRLMCDIVALGFQTDKTRVATLALVPRHLRALFYPFLDVQHRTTTAPHSDRSPEYERICRYYCSQLCVSRRASRRDAGGQWARCWTTPA